MPDVYHCPDCEHRLTDCGDVWNLPPSETEPVRVNCRNCDHSLFVVIYDPVTQGNHVECPNCGEVAFL